MREGRPRAVVSLKAGGEGVRAFLAGFPARVLRVLAATASAAWIIAGAGAPDPPDAGIPRFVDVTAVGGIRFQHVNGPADHKDYIFEAKGGGIGFFDYDNDGWLDVFIVQGATLETVGTEKNELSRLFRNNRDGTFKDVTEPAGLTRRRWGMGVTFGDYDNDGWTDIYLTCFGPNVLYRNNGDGTFTDVTGIAGVGDPRWSTSAAFADYDRDGDLDLYVANYIDASVEKLPPRSDVCTYLGRVVMCGPRGLPGAADSLYRNNGDGTFTEVSSEVGAVDVEKYFGLGVVWSDLDNDGDLDLLVGNDATPNLLFVNDGRGHFEEMGFLSGLAVSGDGAMQASMGIDVGDYNNDGLMDVFITHFASDYSTLYRNEGDLIFKDVSSEAGIQAVEWLMVGWSTRFVDYNHDGWKDLLHVNGHVYPFLLRVEHREKYRQPPVLYLNRRDGTFADVSPLAGPDFQVPAVSRGAAFGDYDNDGDVDLVVANLNDHPRLLRNDRTDPNHWVFFDLKDTRTGVEPVGARIAVTAGGLRQLGEYRRAVGIYSASDPRIHFGLGSHEKIDEVTVTWPDGFVQRFTDVPADHHYLVDSVRGLHPQEFRRP
ncbi:MAG: CRTAC1 family protein [Acidobacteriota bacterium]